MGGIGAGVVVAGADVVDVGVEVVAAGKEGAGVDATGCGAGELPRPIMALIRIAKNTIPTPASPMTRAIFQTPSSEPLAGADREFIPALCSGPGVPGSWAKGSKPAPGAVPNGSNWPAPASG